MKLGGVIEVAFTATASPEVREEIVERLGMRNPRVIVQGFNRPNIWLGCEPFRDQASKREELLGRVEDAEKLGIVYVATRRHAEEMAGELSDRGTGALFYHGGMGIDKRDVRFVFHIDVPESLDAYYRRSGVSDATAKRPRRSCSTGPRISPSTASSPAAASSMRISSKTSLRAR